jgi:hypothetical protein
VTVVDWTTGGDTMTGAVVVCSVVVVRVTIGGGGGGPAQLTTKPALLRSAAPAKSRRWDFPNVIAISKAKGVARPSGRGSRWAECRHRLNSFRTLGFHRWRNYSTGGLRHRFIGGNDDETFSGPIRFLLGGPT